MDREPILQVSGEVVYPGLLIVTVWMYGPAPSLHHPDPSLLIHEVFLSEKSVFSEFLPP
jgi:hypothetical protein